MAADRREAAIGLTATKKLSHALLADKENQAER